MVLASKNAVATHANFVPRSSASEMVGRAVLVTLPSSAERRSGMHIAVKERQNPSARVHLAEAVCEGMESWRVGRLGRFVRPAEETVSGSLDGRWSNATGTMSSFFSSTTSAVGTMVSIDDSDLA